MKNYTFLNTTKKQLSALLVVFAYRSIATGAIVAVCLLLLVGYLSAV